MLMKYRLRLRCHYHGRGAPGWLTIKEYVAQRRLKVESPISPESVVETDVARISIVYVNQEEPSVCYQNQDDSIYLTMTPGFLRVFLQALLRGEVE